MNPTSLHLRPLSVLAVLLVQTIIPLAAAPPACRIVIDREASLLKKVTAGGYESVVIGGSDAIGCLYGVYGMLEDRYGVGFYLGGDVLPDKKAPLVLPEVDERKAPAVQIRGILPWTNFPQSATVYSWDESPATPAVAVEFP